MTSIEIFLIKSAFSLVFFYLAYWLFLKNETYFTWKRLYIIGSLFFSVVIPFIKIPGRASLVNVSTLLEPIIVTGKNVGEVTELSNSLHIVSIIYISGAILFSLRFLFSLFQIYKLYHSNYKVWYHGFKTVILNEDCSSFTFFNILFISRADYDKGKIDEIIVHEKAHYRQGHSYDMLIVEVISIVQWFNPFVWLLRHALKTEHEYIADEQVLTEGFELAGYQKMLFEKSLGITTLSLANSFNYSLLKKRLKMMTHKKSNNLARFKFILSMPLVLAICIIVLAKCEAYSQQEDDVYTVVDVMPEYPGGLDGMRKFVAENLVYPKSAAEANVEAKVFISFVVDEKGKVTDVVVDRSDIIDNVTKEVVIVGYKASENSAVAAQYVSDLEMEAIRVVSKMAAFKPGETNGKKVKVKYTIPIQFILKDKPNK
ncbi:MAG: M56 family metallopeptidase [Bacteroidales bacterium]|nr:M56 family metallopeptidase [Bacteroidales bacterium]